MRIAEIYESVQGEGLLTGTPSVFVRASGCNLRCCFCDTPFASWNPEGEDWGVDQIERQVLNYDLAHVVLTGGEPMLFAELVPLNERLARAGRHLTIETAGTLFLNLPCDLMSISPKLSNSTPDPTHDAVWHRRHESARDQRDVVQRLLNRYAYQLKFVIGTPEDADEAMRYVNSLVAVDQSRVMMMPQGTDVDTLAGVSAWLEPFCNDHQVVFCPRRQIQWYGNVRRT